MARATGQERCVPIRVHGTTCAGAPLREAMFDSISVKENTGLLLLEKPTYPHAGGIDQARAVLLWQCCCGHAAVRGAAEPDLVSPPGVGRPRRASMASLR